MKEQVINKVYPDCRSHLVLLGAGASVAALPKGDKNGKKMPQMKDLISVVELGDLLLKNNIDSKGNFEALYSELCQDQKYAEVIKEINIKIFDYFKAIELPDEPTIYDYLILSLRKKDTIASFNWDPLLAQAYLRSQNIVSPNQLPRLIFLHGNVMIGKCDDCHTGGYIANHCKKCGNLYTQTQLLYPIKKKDYDSDLFIKDSWHDVRILLKRAFFVTIFGYSAPKTDEGAMRLFKEAWGEKEKRNYEQFEIIDIESEHKVTDAWKDFIHTNHYQYCNNYFDSQIALYPRRSVEALIERIFELKWLDNHKITLGRDFTYLENSIIKLIEVEDK